MTKKIEVEKRAVVRKLDEPMDMWKAGVKQTAAVEYELGLDDLSGNSNGHTHNDLGHSFPMTREELAVLCDDIMELLGIDTSGWMA